MQSSLNICGNVARLRIALIAVAGFCVAPVLAADQTQVGAGNGAAIQLASRSPLVKSALEFLIDQAGQIESGLLRSATLDILKNPSTCVTHRRGLDSTQAQDAVIQTLFDQGLINRADGAAFPAGVRAGVFPPILRSTSECPQLPQSLMSAPGSAFGGHHSYPGGLLVHEANNDLADVHLLSQYEFVYGQSEREGFAQIDLRQERDRGDDSPGHLRDLAIDRNVIIAAPIWHDWAKSIVFQWNVDGSEFFELNFGGAGATDAWGAPGDSRTGGHHILSVAEAMSRGLSPLMVITQASAHSAPTLGNEYKVVNWLRAAAIIARIDPVKAGFLVVDTLGHLRLPPLDRLGDVNLNAAGQTNLRVEYTLHNLSDADFTYSGPAIAEANVLLTTLAPEFGYSASDGPTFNTRFRNPVLTYLSGERLQILYGSRGLDSVRKEIAKLRRLGVI